MSIWNKIFPPKDWILLQVMHGSWVDESNDLVGKAYYEFYYSETRRSVKMEIGGTEPKLHKLYPHATKNLVELTKIVKSSSSALTLSKLAAHTLKESND